MDHSKVCELPTPCFIVDRARVEHNCKRMKATCDQLGIQLRSMTKTHKCVEIGVIATGGTKRCISCSTLAECEMFADAGFEDILFTRIFTEDRIPRMQKLNQKLESFHVMVDSIYNIDQLVKGNAPDKPWSVYLKVDTGKKRAGVLWDSEEAVWMAERICAEDCLDFQGIYAHDGHSYEQLAANVKQISSESVERLTYVSQRIISAGMTCKTVGVGSTPSSSQPVDEMARLTELHPGCYVLMDYQQFSLGSCAITDIAGKIATRVSGHYPHRNQLLIDAGFLAMHQDGAGKLPHGASFAAFENEPNLKLIKVNQEVGFVEDVGQLDYEKYPIGSMLFLLPWHACAASAMHGKYYITEGERVLDVWTNGHYW